MKSCFVSCCVAAALLGGASSHAGDKKKEGFDIPPGKRGPEHKVLESLVGTFDCKIKFIFDPKAPPAESTGVMIRSMILDGNYLQESFKGKFLGKDFAGLGIIGYDAQKKKFATSWFDNMSTSSSQMLGTYDADKKILTTLGEDADVSGKKMKARDVLKIVSPDEQHFEMYRQLEGVGTEKMVMEIIYQRRK